jgi:hypothetical protein
MSYGTSFLWLGSPHFSSVASTRNNYVELRTLGSISISKLSSTRPPLDVDVEGSPPQFLLSHPPPSRELNDWWFNIYQLA